MHTKIKEGCSVTHCFTNPSDLVIEKVGDEYIVEIDCGTPTERTFTFNEIFIDTFNEDDEIILGVINPRQFEPFFEVENLVIEYEKESGVGYIEVHCA